MSEFFTWPVLGTLAGASAATALLTQLVKNILSDVPTQIVSYLIAFTILIGATLFTQSQDPQDYIIQIVNAGIISLGANGGFSAIARMTQGDAKDDGKED